MIQLACLGLRDPADPKAVLKLLEAWLQEDKDAREEESENPLAPAQKIE